MKRYKSVKEYNLKMPFSLIRGSRATLPLNLCQKQNKTKVGVHVAWCMGKFNRFPREFYYNY